MAVKQATSLARNDARETQSETQYLVERRADTAICGSGCVPVGAPGLKIGLK